MKKEQITINGKDGKEHTIDIWHFDVPMFHEDFHKAEDAGLIYGGYLQWGPDYWDDTMIFCKPEDKELVDSYIWFCSH